MKFNPIAFFVLTLGAFCPLLAQDPTYLFWADSTRDGIFRMNLDGTGAQQIISSSRTSALTTDGTYFYWQDGGTTSIGRAPVAGGAAEVFVDPNNVLPAGPLLDGRYAPGGLQVHGSKLYWTDVFQDGLYSIGLDGSNPMELLNFGSSLPPSVGSDYSASSLVQAGSYFYWSDGNAESVFRSDLDGSNPTALLSGLRFDAVAVTDSDLYAVSALQGIYKANLDGSDMTQIIAQSEFGGGPLLREIAVHGSQLYVTVDGVSGSSVEGIFTSDLDGENLSQLIDLHTEFPSSHGNGPRGMVIMSVSAVPEPSTYAIFVGLAALVGALIRKRVR